MYWEVSREVAKCFVNFQTNHDIDGRESEAESITKTFLPALT